MDNASAGPFGRFVMPKLAMCPHCAKACIPAGPTRYYSRGWPAVCAECGGLSYDRETGWWIAGGIVIELLLPCLWILGIALFPPLFLALSLAAAAWLILIRWRKRLRPEPAADFKLRPVTRARSA